MQRKYLNNLWYIHAIDYCRGDLKTVRDIEVDMRNCTNVLLGEKKHFLRAVSVE